MLNLKSLSDDALLGQTQKLAKEEREILAQVLHHLKEIQRRRLFCKLKFSSLYEYATKELGYSEDQAYRRIQAMRLLNELPELEEKIKEGVLNLTHLGMAQSLFKREEKESDTTFSKIQKLEVLGKLENTSKREAEKITTSLSSTPPTPVEKIRMVSPEQVEIKFTAPEELFKKIQKLKGLRAHKNPDGKLAALFEELCDMALEKWDKSKTAPERGNGKTVSERAKNSHYEQGAQEQSGQKQSGQKRRPQTRPVNQAQIMREVWKRDEGKCQNCGTHHALEIDHWVPRAMGGEATLENLRILCRQCNQRAAIQAFGIHKMEKHLDASRNHGVISS